MPAIEPAAIGKAGAFLLGRLNSKMKVSLWDKSARYTLISTRFMAKFKQQKQSRQ
jgi:hypothetical protein